MFDHPSVQIFVPPDCSASAGAVRGYFVDDADVLAFYNASTTSALGHLYEVRSQINTLQGRDAYTRYFLAEVQADVAAVFEEIKLVRAAGPNGNKAAWRNHVRALQGQLAWLMERYYRYEANAEQQREAEAVALKSANSAVAASSNICAANEKALNDLFLDNSLWSLKGQPSGVVSAVKAIADQCPLQGGLTVYVARSIYKYFDPAAHWDDGNGCAGLQERGLAIKEPAQRFMLAPNPTDQTLTLLTGAGLQQEAVFEMSSVTGETVNRTVLARGQVAVSVDTKSLPSGVYFYWVRSQGEVLQAGKVVISH